MLLERIQEIQAFCANTDRLCVYTLKDYQENQTTSCAVGCVQLSGKQKTYKRNTTYLDRSCE